MNFDCLFNHAFPNVFWHITIRLCVFLLICKTCPKGPPRSPLTGRAEGACLSLFRFLGLLTAKPKNNRTDWLPSFSFLNFLVFWIYERQLTPNYTTLIFCGMITAGEKLPSWINPAWKARFLRDWQSWKSSDLRNFP